MKSIRIVAAICILTLPAIVSAQTSGSLSTQLTATTPYSTAPWVITAGPGTYPDGGGVATFNSTINTVIGTVSGTNTLTVDVSPTLSGITYNNPFSTTLAAGTGTSIVAATSGLTLNALTTAANTPTLFQLTNTISSPISGGGTNGITKTGAGIVTLAGANTYTGGTHLNGGELVLSGANGDATLGATGAGNGLSFNGGSIFNNLTGGLTTARDIFLDAGGGLFYLNTAATLSGVISGTGSLNDYGFAAVAMTLTNTNTYTGATITSSSSVSSLILSGNGSINTSSSYDLAGTLNLDNSGTTGINRLSDTGAITSHGALITTTGNATTASAETVGAITLANGDTTINVAAGTAGSTLTTAGLNRQNGSALFVRGTGLGGTPGAGVSNLFASVAPTLVGGGGLAGSTTQGIIPWALGNTTASTTLTAAGTVGSGLVTYGANGFRPLATAEYATAFGGNATDNVRLTAATAAPSGTTANAVLFAPSAAATLSGGPINITSGAFVYSPTANATGTVSASLNFGSAEGVLQYTSALGISGVIAGSGGLTVANPSAASLTLSGANTYTGTTTVVAGQINYTGPVAADGVTAGPFGLGTSAVVLNPGTNSVVLFATAVNTFNRDLSVIGTGPGTALFGTTGNTVLTMNGNIDLQRNLNLGGGGTAASAMVINGTISGTGTLIDSFSAFTTINGNNTFTGGLNIQTGTFTAGSDTAFGTGTIFFSGAGTIQGSGTTARTLGNNLFLSANSTFAGTAPLNFTGGVNLNGARTVVASNTAGTTFSGVVSNGALTKNNANGAVSLNSPTGNTYTGGTVLGANVNALIVNNTSGSGTGSGTVSIGATSATTFSALAGDFTISGATSIAGRLSPGNSGLTSAAAGVNAIGTANFGSSLVLSSATTSSVALELASPSSFDRITVAGAFSLAGTVNVTTIGGYVAQLGDSFDLVDFGSINVGTFTLNTSGAATASGTFFDTSTFTSNGVITVVPEPSTWMMVGFGAVILVSIMRFRRHSN